MPRQSARRPKRAAHVTRTRIRTIQDPRLSPTAQLLARLCGGGWMKLRSGTAGPWPSTRNWATGRAWQPPTINLALRPSSAGGWTKPRSGTAGPWPSTRNWATGRAWQPPTINLALRPSSAGGWTKPRSGTAGPWPSTKNSTTGQESQPLARNSAFLRRNRLGHQRRWTGTSDL